MSQVDPLPLYVIESLDASQYIEVAATALAFYEYFTTLSEEVRCIWKRKFSLGSVLFFVNRYVLLLNRLARLVQLVFWTGIDYDMANTTCNVVWRFSETFTLMLYIVIAVFSGIRLYAVWNCNKRLLVLTLGLGFIYPATLLFYDTRLVFEAMPPVTHLKGCNQFSTFENPSMDLIFFLLGTALVLSFETFVVICTWIKTMSFQRLLNKASIKTPLATLIWRDGTVYFVALLVLNAINLFSLRDNALNNVAALTETIVSILLSRFMLHLRESYLATCSPSQVDTLKLSERVVSVRHANRLVGNLGAALDFSGDEDPSPAVLRSVHVPARTWDDGVLEEPRTPQISHNPLWDGLAPNIELLSDSPQEHEKLYYAFA